MEGWDGGMGWGDGMGRWDGEMGDCTPSKLRCLRIVDSNSCWGALTCRAGSVLEPWWDPW